MPLPARRRAKRFGSGARQSWLDPVRLSPCNPPLHQSTEAAWNHAARCAHAETGIGRANGGCGRNRESYRVGSSIDRYAVEDPLGGMIKDSVRVKVDPAIQQSGDGIRQEYVRLRRGSGRQRWKNHTVFVVQIVRIVAIRADRRLTVTVEVDQCAQLWTTERMVGAQRANERLVRIGGITKVVDVRFTGQAIVFDFAEPAVTVWRGNATGTDAESSISGKDRCAWNREAERVGTCQNRNVVEDMFRRIERTIRIEVDPRIETCGGGVRKNDGGGSREAGINGLTVTPSSSSVPSVSSPKALGVGLPLNSASIKVPKRGPPRSWLAPFTPVVVLYESGASP